MRERLAGVAGSVLLAAERRKGLLEGSSQRALEATVTTLAADYGDLPSFAVPGTSVDDVLGTLAGDFALAAHEERLLAVAAAAELDPNLGLAFDLLSGGVGGGSATIGLALELCGLGTATAAGVGALDPSGALRRHRLVEVGAQGTWLGRALTVPDRVRLHLVGGDKPPPTLDPLWVTVVPFTTAASAQVAEGVTAEPSGFVWVHGPIGSAGTATAAAGLAQAGTDALAVDVRQAPARGLGDRLAEALREAALRRAGLVVAGADALLASDDPAGLLGSLAAGPCPVVAVGTRPWDPGLLRTTPLSVEAPMLTGADRSAIWKDATGIEIPEEGGHPPVSTLRLTPEQIHTTAAYATTLATHRRTDLSGALVREAARVLGAGAGSGGSVVRPPGPPTGWDDLVLPGHVVEEIQRLVRWASHRDEVIARGTIHGKGGKGAGIAALFTGGPGTGKTLAAHVVADELNLDLLQVDLSTVVDKYIGETEKNLERVFSEAERRNVVLFFDEADALFGSRSAVSDARDRYANQEVSYLLQRMEHFEGITVMATNLRGNLDPAFSRRMQFILHFPDPDEATRRRLWELHLERAGGTDDDDPVDVDLLAAELEIPGGHIRNVVLSAAYDAAAVGRPVGMAQVVDAAYREYRKLGRIWPRLGG